MPILYIDGKAVLGQSKAIERYLARTFGLMGSNDLEAAQVDMIGEHVRDIKDAYQKAKAAGNGDAFLSADLPKWLAKLEKCVSQTGKEGFAVGDKISLAGLQIYSLCTEFFDNKDAAAAAYKPLPRVAAVRGPRGAHAGASRNGHAGARTSHARARGNARGRILRIDYVLTHSPFCVPGGRAQIVDNVANNEKIKAWQAKRPVTMF